MKEENYNMSSIKSNINLFQGDCLEVMKGIPDKSIVPYHILEISLGITKNSYRLLINGAVVALVSQANAPVFTTC